MNTRSQLSDSPNKRKDFATGKKVKMNTPEESVRQNQEKHLHLNLGYPKEVMDIEVPIQMGVATKKADIVVYQDKSQKDILGIVETKAPGKTDGIRQLESYMAAVACRWGMWTNGEEIEYRIKDPGTGKIKETPGGFSLPRYGEEFAHIKSVKDLRPAKDLKGIFRKINGLLYANTNLARTERQGAEMVRLIFCKIHDEFERKSDGGVPHFQVKEKEENDSKKVRKRIDSLWQSVKKGGRAHGVFFPIRKNRN